MNCIILLFLLSCCGGWGNGCGMSYSDGNSCGTCSCGNRDNCGHGNGCGRTGGEHHHGRGGSDRRGPEGRECGRQKECCCQEERPCCEEERPCREADECGCGREDRDGREAPGMIPPPWQEYPRFPRRDGGEDCEA